MLTTFMACLAMLGVTSCSDDNDQLLNQSYGYVQFRLFKSASMPAGSDTRAVDKLELLNDAKKVEVVLQFNGSTITQALVLNSYNAENAEFGLRSDKLQLLAGEYTMVGFRVYDGMDQHLLSGDVEDNKFTVIKDGLTVKNLPVDGQERGMASFKLVKNYIKGTKATGESAYLFSDIKVADVTLKNMFTQEVVTINKIKVKYTEDFQEGSKDEDLYPGKNAEIAYGKCDTVVWLKAGRYVVTSYTTYSDKEAKTRLETAVVTGSKTFTIADNQLTENVEVPVELDETAEYIKDYLALKEIWLALDGPNWKYTGEAEAPGCNWNFNKEIDMWGEQPGVLLHANGRVASLSFDNMGIKGILPDAIGQLTQLAILSLGSHSEILGGHIFNERNAGMNAERRQTLRMNYHDKVLGRDFREGFSEMMQYSINMDETQKPITHSRVKAGARDIMFGVQTNGLQGISKAVMRLTELEQIYVANAPITSEGFFREVEKTSPYYAEKDTWSWENFDKLYDIEIYNCYNLTSLPIELLAGIPELQLLNIACNPGISGEQLKKDWEAIVDGNSGSRLQILYMGNNNLKEFPTHDYLKRMVKLALLDCTNNKIETLHPFGKEINLTKLYLDNNKIKSIPSVDGYFFGYYDVESFSIRDNELTQVPDIFNAKSAYVMGSIDFSYNQISSFENGENFRGINAGQLNLSNNRLKTFPKELFKTNSPIYYLILAGNEIEKINHGDLEGKNAYMLEALDLTYNKLSELSDDFYAVRLPYLTGLDISYNRFSEFPYQPLSISSLQRYFIRYQRDENGNRCLKEWPTGLYKHASLVFFCMGGNDLRKIDDTISPYIQLFEIKDNPNISIDLSGVCNYIQAGYYTLIYDKTQDIRGCSVLGIQQ